MTDRARSGGTHNSAPPPVPPDADRMVGRLIHGRFQIVAPIARGGMGKVYRAVQKPLGREVALKILKPQSSSHASGSSDTSFNQRFFLEAAVCARLTHPNTVTIFDYGRTDDNVYFIAMELLQGRTLLDAIRSEAPFTPEKAFHIARQIARSLREAHALGLIHRDLKPANVFLVEHADQPDFVKVLDFGLVKNLDALADELTETGIFVGSPKYTAPEQVSDIPIDHRADIYSLGVILYEMLTGRVPFDRATDIDMLLAHVNDLPPSVADADVAVEAHVEALVRRALAKSPDERFTSMDELMDAMQKTSAEGRDSALSLEDDSSSWPVVPMGPPSDSFAPPVTLDEPLLDEPGQRRHRVAAVSAAVAVLLAALLGAIVASRRPLNDPDERAVIQTSSEPAPSGTSRVAAGGRAEGEEKGVIPATVEFRSTPPGAKVWLGHDELGTTPFAVDGSRLSSVLAEALPQEATFRFVLFGHEELTITQTIDRGATRVDAELEPLGSTGLSAGREPLPGARSRMRSRVPMARPRGSFMGPLRTRESDDSLMGYKAVPY